MAAAIRVLYVDDESALLEIGKVFLELSGDFAVTIATSAPDAIRLLEKENFDTIVSDYQMPEMDGIEFLVLVRTKFGDIPFILFTGKGREEVVIAALNSGADGYLQKGSEPKSQFAELSHKITSAVERKRADVALRESEDKYRTLIETTDTGFAFIDQDGLVLDANPEYVRLTGHHNLREIVGRSVIEWTADYEKEKNAAAVKTCFEKGSIRNLEIDYVDSKGNITPIEINATCIEIGGKTQTITICRDITERKRTVWALMESEELFATAFNSGPLMLAISDIDTGIYLNINDTFIRFTGYSRDEAIGKTSIELGCICPEDRESLLQELKRTGRVAGKEFRLTKKDGESGWYLFFGEIIIVSGKKRLLSIAEDITGRKKAEETLRVNEKRLQMAQEIGHIGCWEYDIKTNQMWGSSEGCHLFGYPRMTSSFPIENFASCITEPERVLKAFNDLINEGKEYDLEFIINPKDGSAPRTLHNIGILEKDEQGNPVKVTGITQDITERKRAEDALQKSEEKYRQLVELAEEGIWAIDAENNTTYVNPRMAEMLQYTVDEMQGLSILSFMDDAGKMIFAQNMHGRRQGIAEVLPFEFITKGGSRIYATISASSLTDDRGTYQGSIAVISDITARKKAEETIKLALAEKEVLLREIHHRVKNNLAGILALIELQISSLSDPAAISLLKDMETRIRSMVLVHESLYLTEDLARIDVTSYTETLTRHLVQVYGTATEVRCTIEMGDVTMSIETAIPCGLVMSEIVTNSLKYAFPNNFSCMEIRGEPCTIALTMHREGSDYLLTIADNGIGIPEGIDVTMSHSLGLFLIRFIVEHQLRGSLLISTAGGTAYTIRFSEPVVKERNTDE